MSEINTQEMASEQKNAPVMKKKGGKKALFLIVILLIALLVGGYFYSRYTKTDAYKQKKADREALSLIKEVGSLMILPEGKPAVFIIQDPELLVKQQAFFKGAQKDDRLLVYPEAGKAIVYSPKRHMIVNVGPVTFDPSKGNGAQAPLPKEEAPKN